MIRIGPSSNDILFYEQGHKSSKEAPAWLAKMGLNAYEISFGRGIRVGEQTAREIGDQAKQHGIAISTHAPYYINLASTDPQKVQNSYNYIKRSLVALNWLGGNRLIVHLGAQGDLTREQAVQNCKINLKTVLTLLDEDKEINFDFLLCIETMGRYKWIGDVEEILDICQIDDRVVPCLDFGHVNAWKQGELKRKPELVATIMDEVLKSLGKEKMRNLHIHFSHIIYGKNGEYKHTNLSDDAWSVPFIPLAKWLKENKFTPTIICESQDVMAQDAVRLKKQYEDA